MQSKPRTVVLYCSLPLTQEGGCVCLGSVCPRHVHNAILIWRDLDPSKEQGAETHVSLSLSQSQLSLKKSIHMLWFPVRELRWKQVEGPAVCPLLVWQSLSGHPSLRFRLLSGICEDGGCKGKPVAGQAPSSILSPVPTVGSLATLSSFPLYTHVSSSPSVGWELDLRSMQP